MKEVLKSNVKILSDNNTDTIRPSEKISDFEDLKRLLKPVLANSPAVKAILFGSFARGDADVYSDVDLVIIAETTRPFVERFRDYFTLLEASPAPLEMLIYTPDEFQQMQQDENSFILCVLEEGKVIYEKSET